MKPLLPLAVLLAVMIAGCGRSDRKSDPIAKYRDAQLKCRMQIADIKQQFGEPDSYEDWWNEEGPDVVSQATQRVQYLLENTKRPELNENIEKELRKYVAHRRKALKAAS